MRISFNREGGLGDIRFSVVIDTVESPAEEAEEIERLVREAGFGDLPGEIGMETVHPDAFVYTLTVEEGGRLHTVRATDSGAPLALRPLLKRLTNLAIASRRERAAKGNDSSASREPR